MTEDKMFGGIDRVLALGKMKIINEGGSLESYNREQLICIGKKIMGEQKVEFNKYIKSRRL